MRTIDDAVHALNDETQMVQGMKQFLSLVRENLYEGSAVPSSFTANAIVLPINSIGDEEEANRTPKSGGGPRK
jgi:hypothetical protein